MQWMEAVWLAESTDAAMRTARSCGEGVGCHGLSATAHRPWPLGFQRAQPSP